MSKTAKKFISACLILTLVSGALCGTDKAKTVNAAGSELSNPQTDSNGITTWDCIYFGNYWQNDTNGDGVADKKDAKQPIKWRVLSVNGNDAFLLADQNLDYQAYDEYDTYRDQITWEICTLRQWLNAEFYQNAFDSREQSAVRATEIRNEDNPFFGTNGGNDTSDKVYLLSLSEVWNRTYGFSSEDAASETREAKNTAYVKACGAATVGSGSHAGNGEWWLRTPGILPYFAVMVVKNGDVAYAGDAVGTLHLQGVAESKYAVRPALYLDLSSDTWSKADSVSASIAGREVESENSGSGGENATPTPGNGADKNTIQQRKDQQENANISKHISEKKETGSKGTKTNDTRPGKVVIHSAKNKSGRKISLSWKKMKGAKGYQIQYADNKKFKRKKSKQISKTKYIIAKCKKKKIYYIRIRAYQSDGGKKVYGNWSKVKKVNVKK